MKELFVKIASLGGMSHFSLLHSILAALVRHIYLIDLIAKLSLVPVLVYHTVSALPVAVNRLW